jgi:hypothetical protein
MDERLVKAMQAREVLRGPLPGGGSAYAGDETNPVTTWTSAFGVTTLFLVILVVLLAASTVYYAQYSGALRWLIFAGVVGLVGLVAVRVVNATARDPMRLAARKGKSRGVGGELRALRTTLYRADGGLVYSQLVFDDRMRAAFLEKVRASRDLPDGALAAAMKDPEALHAILRDRELTIFVLESARNARAYPASTPTLPKRAEFAQRARRIMERMEAWQ